VFIQQLKLNGKSIAMDTIIFLKNKTFANFCPSFAKIFTPLQSSILPPDLFVRETQKISSGWQYWREACACPFNPLLGSVLYL
jgi:hypothetical protein